MAQNVVVNGVTYNGVDSITIPTSNGGKAEYKDAAGINCKIYRVTVPTAVAEQFVTLVTGDADVAAHYADEHAMVTVRKITNNSANGTQILIHTNHLFSTAYGCYVNNNLGTNNSATIKANMQGTPEGVPYVRCTSSGDIKVYARRTQNNFGGGDYIVTFSW